MDYRIISTGSKGNAVVIEKTILIDCGVAFKALKEVVPKLQLVLLTHIHSDHFNPRTIRLLAENRPLLRFACCRWLVSDLIKCGVSAENIDILSCNTSYRYGFCTIIPILLAHDVPNCGYKLHFRQGKVFYATDTNSLDGITAPKYNLYLLEANYIEEEMKEKIAQKKASGEFAYEIRAIKNHLSKAKCDDFIYRNIGCNGEYVYLHCHKSTEKDLC